MAFGRFVFKYRNGLAPAMLAFLVVTTTPSRLFGSAAADAVLDVVGILVALAGQVLRVLVIGLAYIKRGGRDKKMMASRLVIEGMFAHCRNPLYVGNFLILSGLIMIWNAPLAYVVLPLFGFALVSMVRAEEVFLGGKFGPAFDDYCAHVNRFVPNLAGLSHTLAQFRFDWRRVIRKEYGTTFAWVSIAIVLLGLQRLEWYGWPAARGAVTTGMVVWLGVVSLYATARWLKKNKRLGSDKGDEASLAA